MKTLTLTDADGTQVQGRIPTGWHAVTLATYLDYHAALKGKPEGMEALVAVSCLCDLPTDILREDVSLVPALMGYMPFLAQLPEASPLPYFSHEGQLYEHVGNLEKVSAGQLEALLTFLQEAEGNPIAAAPLLLAVLYRQQGTEQDSTTVAAASEVFRSLPMSTAWGALAFFLTSSTRLAERIRQYSDLRAEAVGTVEKMMRQTAAAPPSPTSSSRTARWLRLRYLRSVRVTLARF
ncbi:hypothetical protein [Rufibacter quisquiliarum]|uniref:Uncharacterized protein n=1 Tax=Rufibacter quisquiliarum TaxID=1549639 RepID=A0A839G9C4_9BACT|nr:hypothetical protein [Rufibacter quisquiliarum]MBA9076084.1 hypothetical protein [Rufibacter quisquiliarum]